MQQFNIILFKYGSYMSNKYNPQIMIVGAGFSGIGLAIKLKQAGFTNLLILESGSGIGGTWWYNTYPGITVDVPTALYSYSFEPNPNWSHQYAPGAEIQQYIQDCAKKYDVQKYIHLNEEAKKAVFDENASEWVISTTEGATYRADFLISATGALVVPRLPNIEGINDFKGKMIHSASWDHTYDFNDKRIAIIGTGASAIQIIPALAQIVRKLNIFQRSAPWIVPRNDFEQSSFRKKLYKYLPFTQKFMRFLIWSEFEYLRTAPFLKESKQGNILKRIFYPIIIKHRTDAIKDPELLKKVTPDYELGCKRVLVTDDYYPALNRKNVELITDPIVKITENAVVTKSGSQYPVDALVLATGFDLNAIPPFNAVGKGGLALKDYYKSVGGPEGYKGVTVSGMPNFFMTLGPNSGAGSMSTLYSIEVEIEYIVKAFEYFRDHNISYSNVRKEVMDAFNVKLQNEMAPGTVWMTGCHSWYKTDEGKLLAIWPAPARKYAKTLAKFVPEDYELNS